MSPSQTPLPRRRSARSTRRLRSSVPVGSRSQWWHWLASVSVELRGVLLRPVPSRRSHRRSRRCLLRSAEPDACSTSMMPTTKAVFKGHSAQATLAENGLCCCRCCSCLCFVWLVVWWEETGNMKRKQEAGERLAM